MIKASGSITITLTLTDTDPEDMLGCLDVVESHIYEMIVDGTDDLEERLSSTDFETEYGVTIEIADAVEVSGDDDEDEDEDEEDDEDE